MATRTARRQADRSAGTGGSPSPDFDARREFVLRVVWAISLGATFLISRPLWLSGRDYPAVPVFRWLPQPPAPVDLLMFLAVLASLMGVAIAGKPRRFLQVVLGIVAVWLLLDQTRWQPYMLTYTVAGVAFLLATAAPERRTWAMVPLQLSLACTYAWSGVHKLNHTYATSEFAVTAAPLLRWLGIDSSGALGLLVAVALATAVVEAAVGVGLLFPRTRRAAVVVAMAMHAFVMLMLGPLGRGDNEVVWPWNAFMVVAVFVLFYPPLPSARFDDAVRAWWRGVRAGTIVFAPRPTVIAWYATAFLFALAPALSFAQWWDASLSFQLYAGKQRQVSIGYIVGHAGALPPAAQRAVRIDGIVDLAHWSMGELNVTPVTEPRVVREIGRSLARRAPDAYIRVILHGPPDLRSGARSVREWSFEGPDAVPVESGRPP